MTEKLREKLKTIPVGVWINGKWLSGQLYNGSITEILQAIKDYRDEEIKEVMEFIDWLDNGTRSSASWRFEMRKFRQALKEKYLPNSQIKELE